MTAALNFTASLLSGAIAGMYLSVVVNDWRITTLSPSAYVAMHQMRDKTYRIVMPLTGFTTLGVLIAASTLSGNTLSRWLFGAAAALCAVDIVAAIIHQVPLNRAVQSWTSAAPPAEWAIVRDRWERGHRLRTLIGLAFFACSLWAAVGIGGTVRSS